MNKKNFYCEKYGASSKVLIILPGWGDNRKTFDYYINVLEKYFTIYIFDYPGFGNSSFPNKDLIIDDYAYYIYKFIKNNKINNPYLLCHSFGCRISILLIAKYRVLVDRLIIIGGAGIRRKSIKKKLCSLKYKLLKRVGKLLRQSKRNKYYEKLFNKYASNDYKNLSENMKKTFKNIVNKDLRKYLKYIYCPTLLIWGENDRSTPLKDGILMNKRINNSGIVIIKGGTHFVYLEYPYYVLSIILEFFKK